MRERRHKSLEAYEVRAPPNTLFILASYETDEEETGEDAKMAIGCSSALCNLRAISICMDRFE